MGLEDADIKDAKLSSEPVPTKAGKMSGHLALPSDYDELRLFALLKYRFKGPNGIMTLLGKPGGDPDGPFKWDYLFIPHGELKLQVLRTAHQLEIWWWGESTDQSSILKYFENNFRKYALQIENEIKSLEPYTLILNPYARHRLIAQQTLESLKSIRISEPRAPSPSGAREKEIKRYIKSFEVYLGQTQKQASMTLLLVMESAFMAEAYLNLILAAFVRQEIKASQTIHTETLMRKWRTKIERLHIDCTHMKGAANLGDSRVRDAKEMFDLRNRLAHSYPDKKDLRLGEMWFHQSFPILPNAVPFHKYALALNNQLPSIDEAIFCMKAGEKLVEFLTEQLDDSVIEQFKSFAESNPIGFNEAKKIYGSPFGKALIMAFFT